MKIRRTKPDNGQAGYVLLALMLAVTLILIALSMEAPRVAQQIKRDREEELLHRGRDYATAIKRFVHKNGGRYPVSIEQLENTNHIRFLRKRYKDPMTGETEWRLVHFGEAEIKIPTPNPSANSSLGPNSLNSSNNQNNSNNSNTQNNSNNQNNSNQNNSSLVTTNIGNPPQQQTIGGGQIIGIASTSKKASIKEFNDKDHYNDWFFVYDLRLEQAGGTGVTVAAPRIGGSAPDATATGQPPPGGNPPPPPTGSPAPTPTPTVPQ